MRQPSPATSASTSTPPRIWPSAAATPPLAPNRPIARARLSPVRVAAMVAITCGIISAAAAPCATRAASSSPMFGASAHSSEVSVNRAIPAMNSRRRPNASPSRPPTTTRVAFAIP
jgi:hypothetical protein